VIEPWDGSSRGSALVVEVFGFEFAGLRLHATFTASGDLPTAIMLAAA